MSLRLKRPASKVGYIPFIMGLILAAISELVLLWHTTMSIRDIGLIGLMLAGFILMLIGMFLNRQHYVNQCNSEARIKWTSPQMRSK